MWLNQKLSRDETAETPHTGMVTRVNGRLVDVSSHIRLADIPCISTFGAEGMPAVGDTVLVLPTIGGYACIGIQNERPLPEGEVRLTSPGGAELLLKADGSISLNGLIITKEGALLPKDNLRSAAAEEEKI